MFKPATIIFCLCISLLFLSSGCVRQHGGGTQDDTDLVGSRASFQGKVIEKSTGLKTLSLETIERGRARSIHFYYDDKSRGIDYAEPGKQVLINSKKIQGKRYIQSMRPDLDGLAAGVREISPQKVRKLLRDREEFLLIDSRSPRAYRQAHLPSAVNIPTCSMDSADLLPEKKDTLLVFYCGGPLCGISRQASTVAARAGYTNIRVMLKGIDGWLDAGYRTVAEDRVVVKGGAVVIDLRPARRDTVERIPGSVSIPFDTLGRRMAELPRKAPVIVYSDDVSQSVAAVSRLHNSGFAPVSMIKGNFQGWKERKQPVTSGAVVTTIRWRKPAVRGEISPAEFQSAVSGQKNGLILDVRTTGETSSGTIHGARTIPLNDLYQRLEELPRDRAIYIYSSSGARARMAARLLRQRGYRTWFLDASVECGGGKCAVLR